MLPSDIARSFLKQFPLYRSTTDTGRHWYTPESLTSARRLSNEEIKQMIHRYIDGQFVAHVDPDNDNTIYRYLQDLASNESVAFQRWMELRRNGVAEGGDR
jgi:hypothetical protein